jgi:tripartite-type tricarboxylate transporter receptor subunit TctC
MKTTKLSRREVLAAAGGLGLAATLPSAWAQAYPGKKPIRIVVPYAAGGSLDAMSRDVAVRLQAKLGQTVIIENKPGASTMLGTQQVARAEADGYTLLIASSSFVSSTIFYRKPLHKVSEFAPITQFANDNHMLVVNPERLPVKTLQEFVAYAKANPGKINYGTAGTGTSPHLEGEEFAQLAGIKLMHVPFNGSAPGVTALVGGQIDAMFDAYTSSGPHVRTGRLRTIAVLGKNRLAELPDVPTIAESGYPSYVRGAWDGLLAPAGTPADVVQRLHAAMMDLIKDPELLANWAKRGLEPVGSSPAEFAAFLQEQTAINEKLSKTLGLQLE